MSFLNLCITRRAVLSIAVSLIAACGGGAPSDAVTTNVSVPPPALCSADASSDYLTADFFVDSNSGDDANNGSSGTPWKTLTRALAAPAPAVVHVRTGNYGVLTETTPVARAGFITLRAAPGQAPILTGVNISYPLKSTANLRLVGFAIKPDHRNGAGVINVRNVTDFELLNNTVSTIKYAKASATPGSPLLFDGIDLSGGERVLIKSNCITSVFRGVQVTSSANVTIQRNYISPQSGTGIQYLSNNSDTLIEDNHIRGGDYTPYPADPDAPNDPHASIISIRSGFVTIRNNIMHGMGSSSGIMFYLPDVTGGLSAYSNITIEGNLLYDARNDLLLRMYNVADQIVIRNNLLISRYRLDALTCNGITNDARYRYNTALIVHSLASGFDGSGVNISNNIMVGIASFPTTVAERNNIMWSYNPDASNFVATSPSGTSKIVTSSFLGCGNHSSYFESGFFASTPVFSPAHGRLLNLVPSATSEAVAFGDAALQLQRILGTLDANGFFVNATGNRAIGQHSAGPYEP